MNLHSPSKSNTKQQYIISWLYFDTLIFYDCPFPFVYSSKNAANIIFPFNSWLSFQRLCRLLRGYSSVGRTRVENVHASGGP